jgi:hypothetical protein
LVLKGCHSTANSREEDPCFPTLKFTVNSETPKQCQNITETDIDQWKELEVQN